MYVVYVLRFIFRAPYSEGVAQTEKQANDCRRKRPSQLARYRYIYMYMQQIYEMCTSFRLGKERKSTSKCAAKHI